MPIVLQINSSANKGSTGKIAEEIGKMAIKNGWRSLIAYGRTYQLSDSELIHVGSVINVIEHILETRLLDNDGLASRIATKRLIKRIKQIQPDIIHLHNIHGYYINYKILFSFLNKNNIPLVWTFHDCWAFTGHCAHFEDVGCEKWETGCHECPLTHVYPKSLIDNSIRNYRLKKELFTSNNNFHVVAVSKWVAEFVKRSFLKGQKLSIIRNGVDLNVFHPVEYKAHEQLVLLGVSNIWTKGKGLEDFYKLRGKLDMSKYKMVLVGLNSKQLQALPSGIIGIGRTESVGELSKLYATSDLFINLTYADTFPTVNIEALACGTPVITYNTGGSPEAVTADTGWVVERGNLDGVVSIVKEFELTDMEKRLQQRDACRRRAEREYNKIAQFEEYLKIYESMLVR